MSFCADAQEFVEAFGKAPLLPASPESSSESSSSEAFQRDTFVPLLDAFLEMPEEVMVNTCKSLGLSEDYRNSLTLVIQALISTNEDHLKPAQARPNRWNDLFQEFPSSFQVTPAAYEALLKKNERDNRIRLEQDRCFMRLSILLLNAFAHRIQELRATLLSYVRGDREALKRYFDLISRDDSNGEGMGRIEKAVEWNLLISGKLVVALCIHMAFHQSPGDGFDLFRIRPIYEAINCGLFGASLFLGMLAVPSGCLSVFYPSRSHIERMGWLIRFLREESDSWFFPSQLFSTVSSLVLYRPSSRWFPVEERSNAQMIEDARELYIYNDTLREVDIKDVRISVEGKEWIYAARRQNLSVSSDTDGSDTEVDEEKEVDVVEEQERTNEEREKTKKRKAGEENGQVGSSRGTSHSKRRR